MSQYVVTDTELTAVANAIRSKGGIEANLEWPSAFVSAIGAITTGGGGEPQSGGGSNIRHGVGEPASNLGNDGDVYFKCSFIPAGSTDYIRTNNVALNIALTNYTYNTNDKIQFVYKKASVQSSQWPLFLVAGYNGSSSALLLQENRYSGRQVINLAHAGAWAGDGAISVGNSIDSLTAINEIILDGYNFSFKSDGVLVTGPVSVGTNTNSDSGNPILFPNLNTRNVFDVLFYRLAIYRNDVLIHDYRPAMDGVIDIVTGDTFTTSETGYINGTAYSNDTYIVNDVYYKNSGSWSSINDANIEDINMNGGGSGLLVLTRSEWNALTTAQKRAYDLVVIQDSSTGYDRGELVNGADYFYGSMIQSGDGSDNAVFTVSTSGTYQLFVLALNSEASTYNLNISVTKNGSSVTGQTLGTNNYQGSGSNRRNYRLNMYNIECSSGDELSVSVTDRNSYSRLVYALCDTYVTTLAQAYTAVDNPTNGLYNNEAIVLYGTMDGTGNAQTINIDDADPFETVQTANPGNNYKSSYIFWLS